jgi:hypothetical protein
MTKENAITSIEEFYCQRLTELVDQERYEDSDAFFQEFVVNSSEPHEWMFLDVCRE